MACEIPFRLPRRRELLSQCLANKGVLYHTNLDTLQLMACKLSLQDKGFSDTAIATFLQCCHP